MTIAPELRQIGAIGQAREIRKHDYYKCPDPCPHHYEGRSCVYCDGGLAFCNICKKGEAELEDECPGHG